MFSSGNFTWQDFDNTATGQPHAVNDMYYKQEHKPMIESETEVIIKGEDNSGNLSVKSENSSILSAKSENSPILSVKSENSSIAVNNLHPKEECDMDVVCTGSSVELGVKVSTNDTNAPGSSMNFLKNTDRLCDTVTTENKHDYMEYGGFYTDESNQGRSHDRPIEARYQCISCGEKLSSKLDFIEHLQTHTGDTYSCDASGKFVADSFALTTHN